MTLTAYENDSASLLVHAFKQEKSEEPVSEIVGGEGGIKSVARPRLFAKVLEAGVQDEAADWRDLSCGNTGL